MQSTSDERREVAKRLREYGNDTLKDGSLLKTLKDVTEADSWRHVLLALAELIDHATSTTTFTPEDSPLPLPVRLWVCARCGEEVITMNDEGEPVACPYCGASCVDDEGDIDVRLILNHFADLIDPTCRNVSGYLDVFECSECRCRIDLTAEICNEYGEPFHVPFCPNCGARVVNDR